MSDTTPTSNLYRRLLSYAFQYKGFFTLAILGFVLFSLMEASLIKILDFFVDRLGNNPSEPLPFLSAEITNAIYFVPVAVVVLAILRGIGQFLGNYFMSRVGLNVVNTLRKEVFSHILYLPQSYFDKHNSGELVSLIIYNIEQVTGSVTNAVKIFFRDGLSVVFFLSAMIWINWQLTLIFFIIAPILGGIIYLASQYFRKTSRKMQTAVGDITHISTETFQGVQLVKSYLGETYENARFETAANQNLKHATKFERAKALQTPILHIVIALAMAVIFYLVMKLWTGDAGEAVAYVTFAGAIAKPFRQLSTLNSIIQRGMAAAETIFATIDIDKELNNGQNALENIQGEIVFQDVDFSYDNDELAIEKLNLTIKPGETVALVGSSGSGKTTIASLLLRFYNPQSGSILIDGKDISEVSLESLRQNIALVNQQTTLFNDSVTTNIAYGGESNSDNDEVKTAAENAFADNFINELEQGYDTVVGEDGSLLSGGQRQRVAIARALYKNAPILILDEATSALDNESEAKVQVALENLKQGRTTLVIAHRLSTIENADRIVVLKNGKIIEEGDHHALMEKNGAYAQLHNTELS